MSATPAIAASQVVNVSPGVIGAGPSGVDLIGLILSYNTRVPIGTVGQFSSAAAVTAYFGPNTVEAGMANVYFNGYINGLQTPGSLLFAQYPWQNPVAAYLRGGSVAAYTLAQLQALGSGTVIVTINGTQWTSASINLSGATSFSNAASLIQTGLAANDANATGSIAPAVGVTAGTSTIAGTVLTVITMASGAIVPGAVLTGGTVTAGTTIVNQLTGAAGGAGTYTVSVSQTVSAAALTATNSAQGVFTAASALVGAFAVGQILAGSGVTVGTAIVGELTGSGGLGTYIVTPSQTASSTTITGGGALVTYDSVSGGFIIKGGTPGAVSTIGFATGTLSTGLKLTQATGAVTSQGSALATPNAFMSALVNTTQNWGTLWTAFEPVNADKEAFSAWNNSVSNGTEYVYDMWSTDILDTQVPNTGSAWAAIQAAEYAGTSCTYAPINGNLMAAFVGGFGAALNFNQNNGRATAAFKSAPGLLADVSNSTIAANLITNGVNFYGTYSTPNQDFTFFRPGSISGPFQWLDSFYDQIWLNNQIVITTLAYLTTIGSFPYTTAGYTAYENVLIGSPSTNTTPATGSISQALDFGAIRAGVPLSSTQIAYVNGLAGFNIASTIQAQGYYILIQPATPAVRAARGSPPITLFYTDGQSVQTIAINSLEVA